MRVRESEARVLGAGVHARIRTAEEYPHVPRGGTDRARRAPFEISHESLSERNRDVRTLGRPSAERSSLDAALTTSPRDASVPEHLHPLSV